MKVVIAEYGSGPLVAMGRIELAKSQTRGVLKLHTPKGGGFLSNILLTVFHKIRI